MTGRISARGTARERLIASDADYIAAEFASMNSSEREVTLHTSCKIEGDRKFFSSANFSEKRSAIMINIFSIIRTI